MSFKSQFGTNVNAMKKRVRWYNRESTAETIYQGQPVCYLYDTTTNVLGYDKGAGGHPEGQTSPTTTAEGNQNEGKFLLVEKPDSDNLQWFAGVVAQGSWCGKSVAATDWEWVEIYIPNGAIVPVRTDCNCTVGTTPLCLASDSQELTSVGRPVALAEETVDRSSTSGIVLAKVEPSMWLYQTDGDTALSVDDELATTTGIMNNIYITEAQTAGSFVPLYIHHTSTGNASATLHEYNILSYLNLNGTYDQAGYNRNILSQLDLSGTLDSGGAHFYSVFAQLSGTPTATEVGHIAAVAVDCSLGANPTTGNYTGILIGNNGANQTQVDSALTIYGNYGINRLFDFQSCDGLTANFISNGGTGDTTIDTGGDWKKIKVRIGTSDFYICAFTNPSET
jgi:hypothetical protein